MALNKSVRNINYKINFSNWLVGLIDGDGYLGKSKKGYTRCEISVGVTEHSLLLPVQERLGGRITLRQKHKLLPLAIAQQEGYDCACRAYKRQVPVKL